MYKLVPVFSDMPGMVVYVERAVPAYISTTPAVYWSDGTLVQFPQWEPLPLQARGEVLWPERFEPEEAKHGEMGSTEA